jgi:hypothetical protein
LKKNLLRFGLFLLQSDEPLIPAILADIFHR